MLLQRLVSEPQRLVRRAVAGLVASLGTPARQPEVSRPESFVCISVAFTLCIFSSHGPFLTWPVRPSLSHRRRGHIHIPTGFTSSSFAAKRLLKKGQHWNEMLNFMVLAAMRSEAEHRETAFLLFYFLAQEVR